MTAAPPRLANRRSGGVLAALARWMLAGLLGASTAAAGVALGVYVWYAHKEQTDLSRAKLLGRVPPANEVVDALGRCMGQFHGSQWREVLPYEHIPRTFLLAVLATEDARFFSHSGLDVRGILRALVEDLRAGHVEQGGSTITQQVAKTFVGNSRTLERKIREAIVAQRLERAFSKEDILLAYVNRVYYGAGAYGVQAAALTYFGRPVWNLTLGEMALLAGLPQSPSRLDPYRHPAAARQRRNWVLERMETLGFISPKAAAAARAEPLRLHRSGACFAWAAPQATRRALAEARKLAGTAWRAGGVRVETTLELDLAQRAEMALQDGLHALDRRQGWRGPLAYLTGADERRHVLERTDEWLAAHPARKGDLALGIVDEVQPKAVTVKLGTRWRGHIDWDHLEWAGPYTEFPSRPDGRGRDDSGRVSLDVHLRDARRALHTGDAVLVRLLEPLPRNGGEVSVGLEQVPRVEGAFVAFDRHSGAVAALVGSYDDDLSEFDRTRARRPTGSTMKPIVYSLAYALGLPPWKVLSGAPFATDTWRPTGDKAVRDMMAWDALIHSENRISLRVFQWVLRHAGVDGWKAWVAKLGLGGPVAGYPSEVLGTDQSPWDMTGAYGVLANSGRPAPRRLTRKVVAGDGTVLFRNVDAADPGADVADLFAAVDAALAPPAPPVVDPRGAWLVAANMVEVNRRGTGRRAGRELPFPTAGKTGTLPYDVWYIGWSGRWLAGTWIGADRRRRVLGRSVHHNVVHGADAALPVWLTWMKRAHRGLDPGPLPPAPPAGIVVSRVDPATGHLDATGRRVPHRVEEPPPASEARPGASTEGPGAEEFDF